jgi:hypothetical protein
MVMSPPLSLSARHDTGIQPGAGALVHVDPPSELLRKGAGKPPLATHALVIQAQDTAARYRAPLGTVWFVHSVPPSDVVEITGAPCSPVVPATTQSEVELHEMPCTLPKPAGTVCGVQVVPPSMVVKMVSLPPITQSSDDGHEIALPPSLYEVA